MRVLLRLAQLHPCISAELADNYMASINTIDTLIVAMLFNLIEVLCTDNRKLFINTCNRQPLLDRFALTKQLLTYRGCLYVNCYTELCTKLIWEAHN